MERSDRARGVTAAEIAALLGVAAGRWEGTVARVSAIAGAGADCLVFAADEDAVEEALRSEAGLILGPVAAVNDKRVLRVADPRTAFAMVFQAFFNGREGSGELGQGSEIDPSAVIEMGAEIGEGSEIGAGAVIGAGVRMGVGCRIAPRVVIYAGTEMGARVVVQAGAVLGSAGFGYVRGERGYVGFPQIGRLVIGDDVEIGANTTIDRGALGETRIGRGTKIDNLVHIAHNCVIGEDVLIAAQVGMAGSCVIEDGAMLGGQVGLGERAVVGRGVALGGQGGVLPGKKISGEGVVFWGTPARPVREYLRDLARLRRR